MNSTNTEERSPNYPRHLVIICPMFPPDKGGLPDHTIGLANSFFSLNLREGIHANNSESSCTVDVLTRRGEIDTQEISHQSNSQSLKIHAEIDRWNEPGLVVDQIEKIILNRVGSRQCGKIDPSEAMILWQYVPHMYGRAGVNLKLPTLLSQTRSRLKRHSLNHIAQALIAHEITSPLSFWPHLALYAMAHRIQWRGLLKEADRIGVSTEAWINRWIPGRIRQSKPVYLSPSPSNMPVVKLDQTVEIHARNWRLENGLPEKCPMLLFFGSMGGPKQLDWVLETWRTARKILNPDTALALVGGSPQVELSESEKGLFRPLGYLSSRDVSLAFQAADVITLPFQDGVSERRTSFMSGLSHGKAVATTLGPSTGATLRNSSYFVSSDYQDPKSYVEKTLKILGDPKGRSEMGAMARLNYQQFMDWPIVWNRLTKQTHLGPN